MSRPAISIIIASNRGPAALEPCLRSIAAQQFPAGRVEVLIGFNGTAEPPELDGNAWPFALRTRHIPEANVGAARNRVLDIATGELLLLLNDDITLAPSAVERHVSVHRVLDEPGMVLGSAEWRAYRDQTVFDELVQKTSLIFFYDQMQPRRWYGFRHAWTLNLSLRREYTDAVRFDERLAPVNFDDLEWAWRLQQRHGLRVWYEPAARATHDHRYTLQQYLDREALLGRMAHKLARANPACFRDVFGRPLDDRLRRDYRFFVQDAEPREEALRTALQNLAVLPLDALPGDQSARAAILATAYEAQRPLKRLLFRRALLEACEDARVRPACAPAEPALTSV